MDATAQRQPYPSDLTDAEWATLAPELPPPVPAGAPRTTDLREVVNAILYQTRNGCVWSIAPANGCWLSPSNDCWAALRLNWGSRTVCKASRRARCR